MPNPSHPSLAKSPAILLIEDSVDYTEIITDYLTESGCSVDGVPSVHDAYQLLEHTEYDLIICDLHLPFMADERLFEYVYSVEVGVRTLEELKKVFPDKPFLAVTAAMESDTSSTQRLQGLVPILYKPFAAKELISLVEALVGPWRDTVDSQIQGRSITMILQ
jgi:CheY-like chemotaxis protein